MQKSLFVLTLGWEIDRFAPRRTQRELAQIIGISQASLAQYVGGSRRPDAEQLRVLIAGWPDARGGARILIAYLRDIVAGDAPGAVQIEPTHRTPRISHAQAEADLELLRHHCCELDDRLTRDLLHDLCDVLRVAEGRAEVWPGKR